MVVQSATEYRLNKTLLLKPEVLEIMEFFRIAHEYHFESAKVCLFSFAAPMVSWTFKFYNILGWD